MVKKSNVSNLVKISYLNKKFESLATKEQLKAEQDKMVKSIKLALISIKFSRYRKGIKFDHDPLAVEQNSYETKIVNAYIVYDWDTWSKIIPKNLKLKNCLLGAANIVIVIKKWVYSGYRIAFDGAGSWVLVMRMLEML